MPINANQCKSMPIKENQGKSRKINANQGNSMQIKENQGKSVQCKSMHVNFLLTDYLKYFNSKHIYQMELILIWAFYLIFIPAVKLSICFSYKSEFCNSYIVWYCLQVHHNNALVWMQPCTMKFFQWEPKCHDAPIGLRFPNDDRACLHDSFVVPPFCFVK